MTGNLPDWAQEIMERVTALDDRLGDGEWTVETAFTPGLFAVYDADGNRVIDNHVREVCEFIAYARSDVRRLCEALAIAVEALETIIAADFDDRCPDDENIAPLAAQALVRIQILRE